MTVQWQSSADIAVLKLRAQVLDNIRTYFKTAYALEVETPILETSATTDPYIESFRFNDRFMRTSPELAMKRLLAGGSGDIYQIGKVFREREVGNLHNPEFTMLEWYRIGWDYHHLMDETEQLLRQISAPYCELPAVSRIDCIDLFKDIFAIDLLSSQRNNQLFKQVRELGLRACNEVGEAFDFLLNTAVRTCFTDEKLNFVYHYPDIHPLLATVDEHGQVQRFEVYWKDIELVNGYSELLSAAECRRRFEQDNQQRVRQKQPCMPINEALLSALEHGMPQCAGASLGIDRLLLCLIKKEQIAQTLAFAWDNI